jgi:hypothetical protein
MPPESLDSFTTRAELFLICCPADAEFARRIAPDLQQRDVTCHLQEWEFRGSSLLSSLETGLTRYFAL